MTNENDIKFDFERELKRTRTCIVSLWMIAALSPTETIIVHIRKRSESVWIMKLSLPIFSQNLNLSENSETIKIKPNIIIYEHQPF